MLQLWWIWRRHDYNLVHQIQPPILNFHEFFNQFNIFLQLWWIWGKHGYNLAHQIQPPISNFLWFLKSILCSFLLQLWCIWGWHDENHGFWRNFHAILNNSRTIQPPIPNFHEFLNQFYVCFTAVMNMRETWL